MSKASTPRWYEDFHAGQRIECPGPRRITDGDRSAWIGFVGDPTPRYAAEEPVVHPLLVLAIARGQLARETHGQVSADLGISGLVPHRPVTVGATLRTTARVLGLREDPTGATGVVWVRAATRDADGVVMSHVGWFRVPKKHRQSATRDHPPALQDHVPARELPARTQPTPPAPEAGTRFQFADYTAQETVLHRGVAHVLPGDIGRFARWFRDDSPLRAPGPAQAASPEHLLGLAHALAHDGLEARLGLAAVNGSRAPHPVVEGDALYAMSQIAAIEPLTDTLGALRVRTFLFRNLDPAAQAEPPPVVESGRYPTYIALDVDTWELMPRR